MRLTKKFKKENIKTKTKNYHKGGAKLADIIKIINKFKEKKKITVPTYNIALELISPNLIKTGNNNDTKKKRIKDVIKKYFGDIIKENELDGLYNLLITNQVKKNVPSTQTSISLKQQSMNTSTYEQSKQNTPKELKGQIKQTVKELIVFFEKLNDEQLQLIFGTTKTIKSQIYQYVKNNNIDEIAKIINTLDQNNNKKKYLQELVNKLKELLKNRKKLEKETNESNTDEDECDFEYFDNMQKFIDEMKKYIVDDINSTFNLDKGIVTAKQILNIIYNIFVKNKFEINVKNIDLSELKKILTECDFEEYVDFDKDLKNAVIEIYNYYKEKKTVRQNISISSRRNSGFNESSITQQQQNPPILPLKIETCNNLQNTIKPKSDIFFEVLEKSEVYSLTIIPQNHQNILKNNFLKIFTTACDNIDEAKNLKKKLSENYNDLDKLYTLYHIFIVDHLQYSNIHIYSNDDLITNHYGNNDSNNSNNNINIKNSQNANYKTLAVETLKKYKKLKDKTFYKFKKYLVTNY